MHGETAVPPGENAHRPLGTQQLLADKHCQHLTGKDLGQPRVVDPRDLMEDDRLVGPALGHQKTEVHVEIVPVPKGPEDGDDPGRKRAPGHNLELTAQGPEGRAAEIAEETAIELEEDPQPLGDGEDDLAMRHVQEKHLPHPLPPLLDALGMTRGAET